MAKTANQQRAIKYFMENNPNLVPRIAPPHLVEFRDKLTKDIVTRTVISLENEYNQSKKSIKKKSS